MDSDTIWQTTTRTLAVVGFVVVLVAVLLGLTVPWGLFVILAGLFFGPDVYEHLGPSREGGA
jgi:hypothetical protein